MPLSDREYRREFYRAVDPFQAANPARREYYVPIYDLPELAPHDVVAGLRDGIEFTVDTSVNILSGFRGSGKTSELLRLKEEMTGAGYCVVYFDIEDYFNTELPIDLGGFALGLAAGFADGCADVAGFDATRQTPRERLTGLLRRLQIEPSVTAGPLDLKASLRDDDSFRAQVTATMRSNRRQFRAELHDFFREASAWLETDRGVVFVVDSIDHFRGRTERFQQVRESVEAVFSELADDLVLPGIHVIYTVPVYIQPALGVRHDILNIKVMQPDGSPYGPGLDALRQVLTKRAPGQDLHRLLGDHTARLMGTSGGLIRDLLRLTGELLRTSDSLPVGPVRLGRAEWVVRNNMEMALSREQLEILLRVARTHTLTPAKEEWADATDLMARGAILRYPNGERAWYGVHPLLMSLLD